MLCFIAHILGLVFRPTDSYYVLVCFTGLILALAFTGSYQSNSNVALLSGPVVYSVLLILLVTLWQNI